MKIRIGRFTAEGFTKALAFEYNGLVMRTPDMLFLSRSEREKILDEFRILIGQFEKLGVEVEGKEKICL